MASRESKNVKEQPSIIYKNIVRSTNNRKLIRINKKAISKVQDSKNIYSCRV